MSAAGRQNAEGIDFEGKHYTLYEATQRQRSLERSIRKTKRKILIDEATGDAEKLQWDQIRLVRTREEYHRFSKAAGLPEQFERMEAAGFDWKKSKAAEKAAKQHGSAAPVQTKAVAKAKSGVQPHTVAKTVAADGKEGRVQDKAVWDDSKGTVSWTTDRRKRMEDAEYRSVREPIEYGTLYGPDGKRILRKKGNSGAVEFTTAEVRQMRGGVLTHNHPGANYGCFSPADIDMLRDAHLAEIRVATPVGVFSMQRPQRWPSDINGLDKIQEAYYDIDKKIGSDYWGRAFKGEMSLLDADNRGQAAVVEEMCRRYKIPFKFDSWESLGKENYETIFRSNP